MLGMRARGFVLGMHASGGSRGFVLGRRAAGRLCASEVRNRLIQPLCAWEAWEADPAALGLSLLGGRGHPGTEPRGTRSEVFGLWVEQLASAPDALPPEVSGVGAPPGFHVWAPSSLICVHATRPQVSAGAPGLLIPCWQSRGGGGRGARGCGCCREFSN